MKSPIDSRAREAGRSLRAAVGDLDLPAVPARRRTALAVGVAIVTLGVALATVAARRDEAAPTAVEVGGPLPKLVPTYVPSGFELVRDSVVGGTTVQPWTTTTFASANPTRGRGELIVSTYEAKFALFEGSDRVRGRGAQFIEASYAGGETTKILSWNVSDAVRASAQSVAMSREELVRTANELEFDGFEVVNESVGNLRAVKRVRSGDPPRPSQRLVLDGPDSAEVTVSVCRAQPPHLPEWSPGRAIEVRGRSGWYSESMQMPLGGPTKRLSLSWRERDDVCVTVSGAEVTEDELLKVAASLRAVSDADWEALPSR